MSSLSRDPASFAARSPTSRKTTTAPRMRSSSPRIAATLSSIGSSVPSLRIRIARVGAPRVSPSAIARRAGSLEVGAASPRGCGTPLRGPFLSLPRVSQP